MSGTLRSHDPHEAVDRSLSALRACSAPGVKLHQAYAGALRWSGVPEVYAPPYFWAPRCDERDGELLAAVVDDAATWAEARFIQYQSWWRADLGFEDQEEYDRRVAAWDRSQALLPSVRPKRRLCLPLFAAYAHDIDGLSTRAIGGLLKMSGTPDPRNGDVLLRFKGAPAIVARGRRLAAELGAWPWANFGGDAPPLGWWADETVLEPLRRFVATSHLEVGRFPYPGPADRGDVLIPLFPV